MCKWCGGKYETEVRYENRSQFCSKECRFDYDSSNFKGANNPNWKGGISPERQCLYASRMWHDAIDIVTQRDVNICQRCGVTPDDCKRLEIHHIIPFEVIQYRSNHEYLITLCAKCHGWVHSSKNIYHELIEEMPNDAP